MKITFLLLVSICLFSFASSAQSLSEQVGGATTDFTIVSNRVDLNVTNQTLLRRAESRTHIDYDPEAIAYGYGYETLHLEFASESPIQVKYFKKRFGERTRVRYEMNFYNENGKLLTTISLGENSVNEYSNESASDALVFYSLDFKAVPVVLLEATTKIDIVLWRPN